MTGTPGEPAGRWERTLRPDDRSVEDLQQLAAVLATGRIEPGGKSVSLDGKDRVAAWLALREKYAADGAPNEERVRAWERRGRGSARRGGCGRARPPTWAGSSTRRRRMTCMPGGPGSMPSSPVGTGAGGLHEGAARGRRPGGPVGGPGRRRGRAGPLGAGRGRLYEGHRAQGRRCGPVLVAGPGRGGARPVGPGRGRPGQGRRAGTDRPGRPPSACGGAAGGRGP